MLTHDITYTTTGIKPSLDLDPSVVPFVATVAVTITPASATFSLQYTVSDFSSPGMTDANAVWFTSTEIPGATNASAFVALTKPVTRIRLNVETLTTGSARLQTLQGTSTY